jgi:hypothetical protein
MEMIRGSRTMITIKNRHARHSWDGQTYKSSHSRQELRLHGPPFRKTAANEDAVVSDLMGDLMSEASQCRSGADHGTRIKRCRQAGFTDETMSKRNQRNRVSYARPSVLPLRHISGCPRILRIHRDGSHIMDKVTKQVKVG